MSDHASTGPRTPEGKAISSQNSLKFGLFSRKDYVCPGEEDEYEQLRAGIRAEISPEGALEETFASEIVTATWRLRRCGLVEADLAEKSLLDPMQDHETGRLQASVDRARAHAHHILRRSVAELRRIQTDKTIRHELFLNEEVKPDPDLTSYKELVSTLAEDEKRRLRERKVQELSAQLALGKSLCAPELDTFESILDKATTPPADPSSFCKTPRNAPCPCGSGLKHKRCCGRNAPAILGQAA